MQIINGVEYYSAQELTKILELKYSSVINLLQKNQIPKIKGKYIVTKEQAEQLKFREKRIIKSYDLDNSFNSWNNYIRKTVPLTLQKK